MASGTEGHRKRQLKLDSIVIPTPEGIPTLKLPAGTLTFDMNDYEHVLYMDRCGFGLVCRVKHKVTGEEFAVKEITVPYEAEMQDQLLKEVEMVQKVATDHTNIVKCHGISNSPGRVLFLLELMKQSLKNFHSQDERKLAFIALQILQGLKYLRAHSIVHRDLKPTNIFFDLNDEVKISDFGLSKDFSWTCPPVSPLNLFGYSSPEVLDSRFLVPEKDKSDIWSLGLCLLEFYSGTFPFPLVEKDNLGTILQYIVNDVVPIGAPPSSSLEFQDFIASCLQRDPTKRADVDMLLSHNFIKSNT